MIVTGTSTSEVVTETKIEGEGETYTYIETEVNGQKQVFETTEPGRYEIKLESSPAISPQPSSSLPLSPLPLTSPELFRETKASSPAALIDKIRQILVLVLSKLFRF